MNRIHRTLWSQHRGAYVAVAETACSRGKRSGVGGALLAGVLLGSAASGPAIADPAVGPPNLAPSLLPSGGQVTAGQASIDRSGKNTLIVNQGSAKAAIEWTNFSIGKEATVQFVQPNAGAVALNRVTGAEGSVIEGALKANGQVFILNPNGVLFAKGARVDTAGLVASTLKLGDADFMAGKTSFGSEGAAAAHGGAVVNQGRLNAADGGYVVLMGSQVRNDGVISARLGTVALAAGSKVSLNFNGDSLVGVVVDAGALDALVANGNAIRADGGLVVLTARGAEGLLNTVVNNTGEIRARTIENRAGRIYLLGENGGVEVAGTLDASAPGGGAGGFVETSGKVLKVADGARVSTQAAAGPNGSWLIDPTDFNVTAGSGAQTVSGIGATTLQTALGAGNVTIQTQASGTDAGNINLNAPLAWSANKLTLEAQGDINVNAVVSATGTSTLNLKTGYNFNVGNPTFASTKNVLVNIGPANTFTGRIDFDRSGTGLLTINNVGYTLINSLGSAGSTTRIDLQGMNGLSTGKYALASNIDASATSGWNSGLGFSAITFGLGGVFDGLGHTVSGLTMNQPSGSYLGLFGQSSGVVRNVGMANASIAGNQGIGALVGLSMGSLINDTVSGSLSAPGGYIGGLAGAIFDGTNTNLHAAGTVTSPGNNVGGLVGYLAYRILVDSSSSSANVTSTGTWTGGLVGQNDYGYINNSSASGTISGHDQTGGLVGSNNSGRITSSSATGAVTGTTSSGGLVGSNSNGQVTGSFATGAVLGTARVGGLIGQSSAAGGTTAANTLSTSYATGQVHGTGDNTGGLIGLNNGNAVANVYARGDVQGDGQNVGGLVGSNAGAVSNAYATGHVTPGTSGVGGLAGASTGSITNSFWNAATTGQNTSIGGGLAETTVQMQDSSLYTGSGWNYTFHTGIWGQKSALNDGFPVLRTFGFTDPITITLTNSALTKSYGGSNPTLGATGWTVSGCDNNATCLSGVTWGSAVAPTAAAGTSISYSTANALVPTFGAGYGTLGNYDVTYAAGALTVNSAVLTVTGTTAAGKTYDRTTTATINAGTLVGLANGETLTLSAGGGVFDSANAGNRTASATLSLGNGSGPNAGLVSNYQLASTSVTGLSAVISPRPVTVNASGMAQKVYDGDTALASSMMSVGNVIGGDSVALSGNGTLASKDVGNPALTGAGSLSLSNANYTLAGATFSGVAMVTPRVVDVATVNGATRTYDGTATAAAGLLQINNIATGDSVHLAGNVTLPSQNVGTRAIHSLNGLTLDNSNYTLLEATGNGNLVITALPVTVAAYGSAGKVYDGGSGLTTDALHVTNAVGGDLVNLSGAVVLASPNAGTRAITGAGSLAVDNSNYTVSGATVGGVATIYPLPVDVSTVAGAGRTYDGTNRAAASLLQIDNTVLGDSVHLSGSVALPSKNVGSRAIGSLNGLTLDNPNYTLEETSGHGSVAITPMPLAAVATGGTQVYDGTTRAVVTVSVAPLAGDLLSASNGSATLDNKNVGTAKTVSVGGIALSGSDAGNYSLQNITASTTTNVTPAALTVTASGGAQVYDGSTRATVTLGSNALAGDAVSLTKAGASLDNKNVGTAKPVAVTGIAISGADAGNYSLQSTTASTTTEVTPRTLNIGFTTADKAFDGSSTAPAVASDNRVVGDSLSVNFTAAYADATVGTAKAVGIGGLGLQGTDAGNYRIAGGSGAGVAGNVTARQIVYTLAAQDPTKTFNVTGLTLFTADTVDKLVAASWANTVAGVTPGALTYTLWQDGQPVAQVKTAGIYEVRASFAAANPTYQIAATGNTNYRFLVDVPKGLEAAVTEAVHTELQVRVDTPASQATTVARSMAEFNPAPPNVVAAPPRLTSSFGEGVALKVLSSPSATEPTESVTLEQARRMVGTSGGGAAPGGDREVRVPVSRNSLAQIVNGGVKLPGGVDQLLFVVKAGQ